MLLRTFTNQLNLLPKLFNVVDLPIVAALVVLSLVAAKDQHRAQVFQFPLQFDRRSGNPHFDSSIALAWQRIRKIPIPPPDRLASILANGLALKLNWRGIQ